MKKRRVCGSAGTCRTRLGFDEATTVEASTPDQWPTLDLAVGMYRSRTAGHLVTGVDRRPAR